VSWRAKSSVSALAESKIASARPRKYGLFLRAEEKMLLYGQALPRVGLASALGSPWVGWSDGVMVQGLGWRILIPEDLYAASNYQTTGP